MSWRTVQGDDFERSSLNAPGEAITLAPEGEMFLLIRQAAPDPKEVAQAVQGSDDLEPVLGEVLMLTAVPFSPEQTSRAKASDENRHAVMSEVHQGCPLWFVLTATGQLLLCARRDGPGLAVEAMHASAGERLLRGSSATKKALQFAIAVAMDIWPAWHEEGTRIGVEAMSVRVARKVTREALQDVARAGVPTITPTDTAEA